MKKIALLFFLLLFLIIIRDSNQVLQPMAGEVNGYLYRDPFIATYEIDFRHLQVNTNNLKNYLSEDMEVLMIKPFFSEVVDKKIKQKEFYFNYASNQKNLNRMIEYYRKTLKENGFIKELTQIDYMGIRILTVRVKASHGTMETLQNREQKIQYQLVY